MIYNDTCSLQHAPEKNMNVQLNVCAEHHFKDGVGPVRVMST